MKKTFVPTRHSPLASPESRKPSLSYVTDDHPKKEPDLLQLSPSDDNIVNGLQETLQKCLFTEGAPKSFYKAIIANIKLVTFHPQQYIMKYGDVSKAIYMILKGSVAVSSNDGETIYAELSSGSYIGEIGVLFARTRTATVIAKSKSLCGMLTKEVLDSLLPRYPSVERVLRDEAQKRLSLQDDTRTKRLSSQIKPINDTSDVTKQFSNERDRKKSIILPNIAQQSSMTIGDPNFPLTSQTSSFTPSDLWELLHDFAKIYESLGGPSINQLYDFLFNKCQMFEKSANDYIFKKGCLGNDIYLILDGEVQVIDSIEIYFERSDLQGARFGKVLANLKKSEIFGEITWLDYYSKKRDLKLPMKAGNVRTANVIAVTPVRLLKIPCDAITQFCDDHPTVFKVISERAQLRIHNNDDSKSETISPLSTPEPQDSFKPDIKNDTIKWNSGFLNSANAFNQGRKISDISTNDSLFSQKRRSSIASTLASNMSESKTFIQPPIQRSKRRLSAFELSDINYYLGNLDPVAPSPHQFSGQRRGSLNQFQYVPHSKRLKYSMINPRRRSSLLAYTPSLPDNILIKIFKELDLKTCMKLRRTCQRWRQILYFSPELFKNLNLSQYNTSITDDLLIKIADFVGPRPEKIAISNCYHITDRGFSYFVNEIGINGHIKSLKMSSMFHLSAMSIMDISSSTVGQHLEELDLSNCKKVRDEVIERIVGVSNFENFNNFGCLQLKRLSLSHCKYVTDRMMSSLANYLGPQLEYLNLKRCTSITDQGFNCWSFSQFPKLRTLILSECTFLTAVSIKSIMFAAPILNSLDLSFCCALDEKTLDFLQTGGACLRKLDLSFCGNAVSDNSLLSLALTLARLEKLSIKGCIRVTRAGVDILLSGCSPLTILNISQCKYAHVYPGGIEAIELPVKPGTRSSFITTSPSKGVVEIII